MIQLIYIKLPDHKIGCNVGYECIVLIENCTECRMEKDWSAWDASVSLTPGNLLDLCRDHRDKLILQHKEVWEDKDDE